jgi:hypothetical protein
VVRGFAFLSLCLVFFGPALKAEQSSDYPFPKPPVNYYDAGESLSGGAQKYLRALIEQRLKQIEKRFAEVIETELAIDQSRRQAEDILRARTRAFGAAGIGIGLVLGFSAIHTVTSFFPIPSPADIFLSGLAVSLGGLHGWSIGLVLATRGKPTQKSQYKLVIDGPGEEILKIAEELSSQIRGMAAPRAFWSMKRLQDFTRRMMAFAALEQVLLKQVNQVTDEMKSALHDLHLERFLVDPVQVEIAEADLDMMRSRIVRKFREIEYQTLKLVAQIYDDDVKIPFEKIDYSKLSETQCVALLKWILSDPITNERDLPDLTDQL